MLQSLARLLVVSLCFAASAAFAANPQVELDTTAGKIRIELYPDAAPKTVQNFLDYVKAGLSNVPGTVSMARTGDPNSATAQFFINVANNKRLDFRSADPAGYGYTVFGKVVDGMDVVNKIAQSPTGPGGPFPTDVPKEHVVIKSAHVVE